jgi:hypothetical protein
MSQEPQLQALLPVLIEISRKRAAIISDMKTALEAGDSKRVLELARRLCGMSEDNAAAISQAPQ